MKRIFLLSVVIVISIFIISGCSTKSEEEKVTKLHKELKELEQQFFSTNSNISPEYYTKKKQQLNDEINDYYSQISSKKVALWVTMISVGVFFGLTFLLIKGAIPIYNNLNRVNLQVDEQAKHLESEYRRRYELIENLVETVKGYAKHERGTLTDVMVARSRLTALNFNLSNASEDDLNRFFLAQSTVSSQLSRLLAVVENYPNLKADGLFKDQHTELKTIESSIDRQRKSFYSAIVRFNETINRFPDLFVAYAIGYKKRSLVYDPSYESVPKISYS